MRSFEGIVLNQSPERDGVNVYIDFRASENFRASIRRVFQDDIELTYAEDAHHPPADTSALLVAYSSASAPTSSSSPGKGVSNFLTEWATRLPKLKVIQTVSAGVDGLPFKAIPEDVSILSNAGAYSGPMAEHAFALVLALAKRICMNCASMKLGIFDQKIANDELSGKTLGILGYGRVGAAAAKIGRAIGMRVIGLNRSGTGDSTPDRIYRFESLDEFLKQADVLLVAAPLNFQSRGLLDASKFALMKPNAILVNVGRAQIIVEDDLYEHLKKNPNFRAGLDVWWDEPRGGAPFRPAKDFLSLPNVLGSPHNSGVVSGMFEKVALVAAKNLNGYLTGGQFTNLVDRNDYRLD